VGREASVLSYDQREAQRRLRTLEPVETDTVTDYATWKSPGESQNTRELNVKLPPNNQRKKNPLPLSLRRWTPRLSRKNKNTITHDFNSSTMRLPLSLKGSDACRRSGRTSAGERKKMTGEIFTHQQLLKQVPQQQPQQLQTLRQLQRPRVLPL